MNSEFPVELADLCVKCGLCAPHCPTYALDRMEPESPRGRIAIMAALATDQIEPTVKAREHLDHCLGCQACEAVCPAKVPYLQLLDAHRAATPLRRTYTRRLAQSLPITSHGRGALRLLLRLLARLRPASLWLSGRLRLAHLTRLLSLIPAHTLWRQPASSAAPTAQVLAGCMGDLANATTIRALERCASALNLQLDWLPAASCCGALAEHHGRADASREQQSKLLARRRAELPLILLDSACANQWRHTAGQAGEELCAFLHAQDWSGVNLRPSDATVLIHEPCSHRHGLRERDAARTLLQRIPGLQIETIADPLCCGAAGTHMLDEPARADALVQPKIEQALSTGVRYLVTTNTGCALHLAAGLRRAGLQENAQIPTVIHPVELLSRHIEN